MVIEALPEDDLRHTAASLDDRLLFGILAAALPVPAAIALGIGYQTIVTGGEYGVVGKNITYGVSSLLVVGLVYVALGQPERNAVFRFTRPSKSELTWAFPASRSVQRSTSLPRLRHVRLGSRSAATNTH
jgi:hypothetical protein